MKNEDIVSEFHEIIDGKKQKGGWFFVFCMAVEQLSLLNTLKIMFYDQEIVKQGDATIINDLNIQTKILFSRLIYIIKDKAKSELKLHDSDFEENKTKYRQIWNMSEFFGHLNFKNDYLIFSVSIDDMFNCLFDILKLISPEFYLKINIQNINDLGLINDDRIKEFLILQNIIKK